MSDFDFLKRIPAGQESDFEAKGAPIRFPLPEGTNADEVIAGLRALNPAVDPRYDKTTNVLSVILPPRVRVGTDPIDLRELAFVIKAQKDVDDIGIPGSWEHCCGDHGGCCANKG